MPSTDPNAPLSTQQYWDHRYDTSAASTEEERKKAESYDWLKDFSFVRGFLGRHMPAAETSPRVLHAGNGNSTLPHSLLSSLNYTSQTAIDFSPVVTSQMSARYASSSSHLKFLEMDIRHLTFPSSSFDCVIDKATLDAMLYGSLWDPEDEVRQNVKLYVDEVLRVLTPGGRFLYITWRQPHFIRPLLVREGWESCTVETVNPPDQEEGAGGMLEYFGWVCTKKL